METINVIIADGTRNRLERIKNLRKKANGIILADQEIVVAAIAAYWVMCEKRDERK